MKTIREIIDLYGGLDQLKERYIKLENKPYMPLTIEYIGLGPHGWPHISVTHTFEQNGDLMRDPEICFEIDPMGRWTPTYYLNDPVGVEQFAVTRSDDGALITSPAVVRDIATLVRLWDNNLRSQGFLTQARRLRSDGAP